MDRSNKGAPFWRKCRVICILPLCVGVMALPVRAGNNSGQAFSRWPDTGVNKCYNNTAEITCPPAGASFYEQDVRYAAPARSYTELGEGTMVRDNVTGLIWEQKTNADGVRDYSDPHDADNIYTWCDTDLETNGGSDGFCGENDTMDFLSLLNKANFGGHNDWRLPTIKELATLVDLGKVAYPLIDPAFVTKPLFSAESNWSSGILYWSATTKADNKDRVWCIDFHNGYDQYKGDVPEGTGYDSKFWKIAVRAVRGGVSVQPTYIDNGLTVTDTVSGLEWQKTVKNAMTWQEALAYADGLVLAGKSDWRLPDKNELRSLLDYSTFDPAINKVFADTTPQWGGNYWTSTTSTGTHYGPAYAWPVGFGDGPWGIYGDKSTGYYVRVVRGGLSILVSDPILQPLPWLYLLLR